MVKAKPCPFCGADVNITRGFNALLFKCVNNKCGAVISFDNKKANITPDVAIYNYNQRTKE